MKKLKSKKLFKISSKLLVVGAISALLVSSYSLFPTFADEYDDKINELKEKKSQQEEKSSELGEKAKSIEEQIADLQSQIAGIQVQIDSNEARHKKLSADIAQAKKDLEYQKKVLGKSIRAMYLEGNISTTEMLASSDDLDEFFNKQQYRNSVKDKISTTTQKIADLKVELTKQQDEVELLLEEQKGLRGDLASKKQSANSKLSATNQKKGEFDKDVKELREEIKRVQEEQQAAYAAARAQWTGGYVSVGGSGGYPWSNPSTFSYEADPWGLYVRQCVSYVAWKLSSQGYGVENFNGSGHAYQWPSTTAHYTTEDSTPNVGDAAVMNIGQYGHVMYVEDVMSNGSIRISEYNWQPYSYSERIISPDQYAGFRFLTFPRI